MPNSPLWKLQHHFIEISLLLLSFLVRSALISKGPYNVDALYLAMMAERSMAIGQLHYLPNFGSPLTVLFAIIFILGAGVFSFSDHIQAVNFMSVVFSSLSVLLFYRVSQKLVDDRLALFSSILFSVSPIFLGISVYGKDQIPCLFFLLLGLWLLLCFQENNKRIFFYGSAVSFGLMGATRLQDLVFVIPALSFLFFFSPLGKKRTASREKIFINYGVFILVIIISAAPFYTAFFLQEQTRADYLQQLNSSWETIGFWEYDKGFFSPAFFLGLSHLQKALTLPGIVTMISGFVLLLLINRGIFIFLLLWVIFPLAYYSHNGLIINSRFLLILLPPLLIAQGCSLSQLSQIKKGGGVLASGVFVFIVVLMLARILPNVKFRHDHALLPDFVRWTSQLTEPNARIIVADEGRFFNYYGERLVINRPMNLIKSDFKDLVNFKNTIDQLLLKSIPVYITTVSLHAYDRDQHFSDFMKENYDGDLKGEHLYEDWHRGEMEWQVFPCALYRLKRK